MSELFKQLRAQLEASHQDLDELTLAKLRAARLRAIATPSRQHLWAPAWVAASAFIAVLWLGISTAPMQLATLDVSIHAPEGEIGRGYTSPESVALPEGGGFNQRISDDLDLLAATEEPEFYAEEWEFYAWLAEQYPADAG